MKCNTCSTSFAPIPMLEDTNQASGCSAEVYYLRGQHYILAYYGSRYDMQRYAMKENANYNLGNICDDCIGSFINNGKAMLIEDGVW